MREKKKKKKWVCWPGDAIWIEPSLVQVMASYLFCTRPLSEPMLICCQLIPWKQISVKFEPKLRNFKMLSAKC